MLVESVWAGTRKCKQQAIVRQIHSAASIGRVAMRREEKGDMIVLATFNLEDNLHIWIKELLLKPTAIPQAGPGSEQVSFSYFVLAKKSSISAAYRYADAVEVGTGVKAQLPDAWGYWRQHG